MFFNQLKQIQCVRIIKEDCNEYKNRMYKMFYHELTANTHLTEQMIYPQ